MINELEALNWQEKHKKIMDYSERGVWFWNLEREDEEMKEEDDENQGNQLARWVKAANLLAFAFWVVSCLVDVTNRFEGRNQAVSRLG